MKQDKTQVFNMDCMDYMQSIPDGYFELAIVDPEFGIGIGKSPRLVTDKGKKAKKWDDKPISMNYFDNLYRISKNQIIWGGNYYALPSNKHCIIWDKIQPEDLSFGMFDYAWTSFNGSNKIFRRSVQLEKDKIHPTQKPIKLYEWLLMNYAKYGDKILDTHLGSQSSRIAAYNLGFEFVGTELDQEYFDQGCKRFDQHKAQLTLF
jgi:site-specific DNA-methyltransferase (adenine-specific)